MLISTHTNDFYIMENHCLERTFNFMCFYLVYYKIAFSHSVSYLYRQGNVCIIKICTTMILRYKYYFQINNKYNFLWSLFIFFTLRNEIYFTYPNYIEPKKLIFNKLKPKQLMPYG